MKLLSNKKYYELIAKIYDQEQELIRKNTYINTLKGRCDLVSRETVKLKEQAVRKSIRDMLGVDNTKPLDEQFESVSELPLPKSTKSLFVVFIFSDSYTCGADSVILLNCSSYALGNTFNLVEVGFSGN